MRKRLFLKSLVIALFATTLCCRVGLAQKPVVKEKPKVEAKDTVVSTVVLPQTKLSLPNGNVYSIPASAGNSDTIVVVSNANYQIVAQQSSWLKTAKGEKGIVIIWEENKSANPRVGTFKVKTKDREQSVTINQAAAKLVFNVKNEVVFDVKGGLKTVDVNANTDSWTLSANENEWCAVKQDNSRLRIDCKPNNARGERSFSFDIKAGGESRTITVKQEGILLEVTPKKLEFSRDGESQIIRITRNVDKVKIDDSGLEQFFNIEEQNSDSIIIAAGKNVSVNQRKSRIIITAGEVEEIINIFQDATSVNLSVNIDTVEFSGVGGNKSIPIKTNAAELLNIVIPAGSNISAKITDSEYLLITASKNDFKTDKTNIIKIKADTVIANIVVHQKKREYWTRVTKDHWHTVGLSAGWVTKNWKYSDDGSVWGVFEQGSQINGFQAGLRIDPYFSPNLFGLGIHTGFYYSYFDAKSDKFKNVNNKDVYYQFIEHTVTVPLHLNYRFDFDNKGFFGIFFHGGLNFDIGILGEITEEFDNANYRTGTTYKEDVYDKLGRFDLAFGYGVGFNLGRCLFECNGSRGILNHSKSADYQLHQNSYLTLSFSLMFNN
jgi:hypothetical protein